MSVTVKTRKLSVAGHAVEIAEAGSGPALLYLHGFADVHGASSAFMPFHEALAKSFRVIAPAHPCCAGSDEDDDIETMDDLAFRYAETMDALGLDEVAIAGACVGGWIAAELAVRHPERVTHLVLIGASGLQVPDQPIGDLFWEAQPRNGTDYSGMRRLLFGRDDAAEAVALFPDSRGDMGRELTRYKTMRFASRIGFNPPYFYDRHLRRRLHRYGGPSLVLWGEDDRMVPRAHGEAYTKGLAGAELRVISGAGHSPQVERPAETAALISTFLLPRAATRNAAAKAKPKAKARAGTAASKAKPNAKAKPKTKARSRKPVSVKTRQRTRSRR
jgi:pimeloyl-ACP methyl ester carboxylesterase